MEYEIVGQLKKNDDLQRTEKWFESRKGKFTGSKIKYLMGTGHSTAKMGWNDINKVFDFNNTSLKYIYKVGMERITGISEYNASTFAMNFGTENEPKVKESLIKNNDVGEIKELEFIDYPHEDLWLGASPDGKCIHKGEVMNLEVKSATSWNGVYDRMEEEYDEKHQDFWQIQLEMAVQKIEKTLFVVSFPMQSKEYLTKIGELSDIHLKAIIRRVRIANECIRLLELKGGVGIRGCLEDAIAKFKIE